MLLSRVAIKSQLLTSNQDDLIKKIKDKIEKSYRIRPSLVTIEIYSSEGFMPGKVEH